MANDWLLVETLGDEPVVVALGRQLKNMVPLGTFLRRNPGSAAIVAAVRHTAKTGRSVAEPLEHANRVIRTDVVRMTDGCLHGVQVWTGHADQEPPPRPTPGPAVWDVTTGVSIATPQSMVNKGMDPDAEPIHGRTVADELPRRGLNRGETQILAAAINCKPGDAISGCWEGCDREGKPVPYGFVARATLEPAADGTDHRIFRSMNWRCGPVCRAVAPDDLAQRILDGLAQPGTHRALVSLDTWTLLKWLDAPCPHYDWRPTGEQMVHPDDESVIAAMTTDFTNGPACGVVRLKGNGGGWVGMHVTVNRFNLDDYTIAGLISLRLPTEAELGAARLTTP
jgi:hypothetical protein